MAHKMKGFPMQDTSSKHGTNTNYQKSGAPGFFGQMLDPLGLFKKAKGLVGGKGKPCPPAGAAAPAAAGAEVMGTPGVEGAGPATPPVAAEPVVDPNAGVSGQGGTPVPMKKNLKVGAPKLEDKNKNYSTEAQNLLKAVPNREAYNKLSDTDKRGFDKAAKRAGLPTKKTK